MSRGRDILILTMVAIGVPAQIARGQVQMFSIPGDISWKQAEQPPLDPRRSLPTIDLASHVDGISALDTMASVPLPTFEAGAGGDLTREERAALEAFSRNVVREAVRARQAVAVGGDTVVRAGDVMLRPGQDFPRTPAEVRTLRDAGIDTLRAYVNLAHAVLWQVDPKVRTRLLTSPTIYERTLSSGQERILLDNLVDGDPATAFVRVDRALQTVEKAAVVIAMDLERRFPVGLVRFYPRPGEGLRISAYEVETNDGIEVATGVEAQIAGAVGVNPLFRALRIEPNNPADTVTVELDPPRYLQRFKFRSLTSLDYDIAEFEVYNQGFVPRAVFLSKPLPFWKEALPALEAYLGGDQAGVDDLRSLPASTLGRIWWEEEKVGDPAASRAVVSLQTGWSPETLRYFRLNENADVVEWRPHASVVDRRAGEPTSGTVVDLDDPLLRAASREIWTALSADERAAAQTTRYQYLHEIGPAAKADVRGNEFGTAPNTALWSGFDPVTKGELVRLPGGRPFFQLRVELFSDDPLATTIVRNLRFEQDFRRAATRITAEIVPAGGVRAGVDTSFTFALRPRLGPGDLGFNRIRVTTPARVTAVEAVEAVPGGRRDPEPVAWQEVAREDRFFVVGLDPALTSAADSLALLIRFRGRVLDRNTTFPAEVFLDDGQVEGERTYAREALLITRTWTDDQGADRADTVRVLPQAVAGGDVLDFSPAASDRNSLRVTTDLSRRAEGVVTRVAIAPNPFTPNGDGVNDELEVSYDVLRVLVPVTVTTEFLDLAGRRVRRFASQRGVGEYVLRWDGEDESGTPVPPGLYVCRVSTTTDSGTFTTLRTVGVAY